MKTRKIVVSIVAVIALISILSICLVACNAESYEKKLEKAGYTLITVTEGGEGDNYEWRVDASKGDISIFNISIDSVTVTKYISFDEAKKAEENALKASEILGTTVKRVGSTLFVGTEQGVKDAK